MDSAYMRVEGEEVVLLDQQEIVRHWRFTPKVIIAALNAGRLKRYRRPGKRAYYALDEVIQAFGRPQIALDLGDTPSEVALLGGRWLMRLSGRATLAAA